MYRMIWIITAAIVSLLLYHSYQLATKKEIYRFKEGLTSNRLERASNFEEFEYHWDKIKIVISTDAGIFSDVLRHRVGKFGSINGFSSEKITKFLQWIFVMTSSFETKIPLDLDKLIERFGHGHSLPIIATVAIENIQRPIAAVFGNRVLTKNIIKGKTV
ncbi:MAG: hypothetical protein ACYS5F_15730, partial [Planctomycetota bacterium]